MGIRELLRGGDGGRESGIGVRVPRFKERRRRVAVKAAVCRRRVEERKRERERERECVSGDYEPEGESLHTAAAPMTSAGVCRLHLPIAAHVCETSHFH